LQSRYQLPNVGLVIPVYAGSRFLDGLLASINQHWDTHIGRIVVVSNEGENDGTNEIAHHWESPGKGHTPIELIVNLKNRGFGPSVNQGINCLFENKLINYVCVFNVDQEVREYWLYWLLRAVTRDERIGMATSNLIEGRTSQGFQDIPFNDITPGRPMEIFHRSKGSPWLFPRHVLEDVGFFDEQFAYSQSEDSDLCVRIARAGWDFVQVKNSYAFHFTGSEGQKKAREVVGRDFAAENRQKFIAKWGTWEMDEVMPKFYRPIVEEVP